MEMHFSRVFKSSSLCSPSPNGQMVATVSSSSLTIRSAQDLSTIRTTKLPSEAAGPFSSLEWSPSSSRILLVAAEEVHVFSIADAALHVTVRHPAAGTGKPPTRVHFGADDGEILACSAFGLKFAFIDLLTGKTLEVANPKFYLPASASRGFSVRALSGHLALLTRPGGRDAISLHGPTTRQPQKSWFPGTTDAAAVAWTPDGRWLLVWDAPAYGARLIIYTPDGQHFRTLDASQISSEVDADLQTGIKLCQLSPSSELCAVCQYGRGVTLFETASWRPVVRLVHPTTITPKDTLQVWQEQLGATSQENADATFVKATQMVCPPDASTDGKAATEGRPGCSLAEFDASSTLLATRLEDSPTTLWIWDSAAAELRAVLIFHSNVNFSWHPTIRELLLITTQNNLGKGCLFLWDPLSQGPTPVLFGDRISTLASAAKIRASWLDWPWECPGLFISTSQQFVLLKVSTAEDQDPSHPLWLAQEGNSVISGSGASEETPLRDTTQKIKASLVEGDLSTLEDTFSFKYS